MRGATNEIVATHVPRALAAAQHEKDRNALLTQQVSDAGKRNLTLAEEEAAASAVLESAVEEAEASVATATAAAEAAQAVADALAAEVEEAAKVDEEKSGFLTSTVVDVETMRTQVANLEAVTSHFDEHERLLEEEQKAKAEETALVEKQNALLEHELSQKNHTRTLSDGALKSATADLDKSMSEKRDLLKRKAALEAEIAHLDDTARATAQCSLS